MWKRQSGEYRQQFNRSVPRQTTPTAEESVCCRTVKRVLALYECESRAGINQYVFTFGRQAAAP